MLGWCTGLNLNLGPLVSLDIIVNVLLAFKYVCK